MTKDPNLKQEEDLATVYKEWVNRGLKKSRLSQARASELAKERFKKGVSRGTVNALSQGKVSHPDEETIRQLSHVFELPPPRGFEDIRDAYTASSETVREARRFLDFVRDVEASHDLSNESRATLWPLFQKHFEEGPLAVQEWGPVILRLQKPRPPHRVPTGGGSGRQTRNAKP